MLGNRMRRVLAAAAAGIGTACGGGGGGGGGPVVPPPPGTVAAVQVTVPAGTLLVPGQTATLGVTVRDAAGAELTGRTVAWSSSDEALARVSATGEVTAVGAGRVTITATSESVSGTTSLTVREGGVVGSAGGTLTGLGGAVRLVVPAGAVAAPTVLTFERAGGLPRDPSLVLDSGVAIGPATVTLNVPAQLAVTYDPARAPSGVAEADLRLHRREGPAGFALLEGATDPAANVASGAVTQLGTFAVRRPPAAAPCDGPEFRQFDFWVGSWNVTTPGATLPTPSDITLEPGGCAVFEDFANGNGRSLNVYDPVGGRWHQTFLFSNGQRQVLIGGLTGNQMILTGTSPGPPGSFDRWTWTPLGDGRVRQLQEVSRDGGATVQVGFDGTYARR